MPRCTQYYHKQHCLKHLQEGWHYPEIDRQIDTQQWRVSVCTVRMHQTKALTQHSEKSIVWSPQQRQRAPPASLKQTPLLSILLRAKWVYHSSTVRSPAMLLVQRGQSGNTAVVDGACTEIVQRSSRYLYLYRAYTVCLQSVLYQSDIYFTLL